MEASGQPPNQPPGTPPTGPGTPPGGSGTPPGGSGTPPAGPTPPAGSGTPPAAPSPPAGTPPAGKAPTGSQPSVAPQSPEQRIDGLRAWIAQVDRKLGVRSYAGGAAIVLALAAGIVGVVLAISAKDESASKEEVLSLRDQVEAVQQEASQVAEESVASLTEQVEALENRVNQLSSTQDTTDRELSVVQDDIDDLRNEISELDSGGGQNP
jgi:uncharacterized protein HemX